MTVYVTRDAATWAPALGSRGGLIPDASRRQSASPTVAAHYVAAPSNRPPGSRRLAVQPVDHFPGTTFPSTAAFSTDRKPDGRSDGTDRLIGRRGLPALAPRSPQESNLQSLWAPPPSISSCADNGRSTPGCRRTSPPRTRWRHHHSRMPRPPIPTTCPSRRRRGLHVRPSAMPPLDGLIPAEP